MYDIKSNNEFIFPDDFLFGASTSSYQIEGNNFNADWYYWEKINNIEQCGVACDSWNRYEDDIKLLKAFNLKSYRMSIEWSRVCPLPNVICYETLRHYEKILTLLKDNDIKVFLSLQHHTLPNWIKNGWANKDILNYFDKYVKIVGKRYHNYVDAWLPVNEPAVNAMFGYLLAKFPPGISSHTAVIKSARNQIKAQCNAYRILKDIAPEKPVGFVKQMLLFKTIRNNIFDKLLWLYTDYSFNTTYINSFKSEKLPFSLYKVDGLKDCIDFWGINYYTHCWVSFRFPEKRCFSYKKNTLKTQMGWEWDPEGLYQVIERLWKINKKPIYITENGLASDNDNDREKYIYLHLKSVLKALKAGINVKGYFYWSLLDNFEWEHGYKPKFGLAQVDNKSFSRVPKPSGFYLGKIAKNRNLIKPKLIIN